MKKTIATLAPLLLILAAPAVPGAEHHVKASLASIGDSGVSGFVELTQLPHGGTNLHLIAHGLHPGTVYASFYYESADCSAPADLLGTFTANPSGTGEVHGKIDDDLDEVGSVSVRLGPGYGTLIACASVH
ncbi:MAG TPA: hypothetical protein VGK93_00845 [Candidatus Eisenbacteria bacterium]